MRDLEPELVGKTVAPFERMRQLEMRFRLVGWQGLVGMAVGAIDMALWDALGCAVNLPWYHCSAVKCGDAGLRQL